MNKDRELAQVGKDLEVLKGAFLNKLSEVAVFMEREMSALKSRMDERIKQVDGKEKESGKN